jgi:hypothetical protein
MMITNLFHLYFRLECCLGHRQNPLYYIQIPFYRDSVYDVITILRRNSYFLNQLHLTHSKARIKLSSILNLKYNTSNHIKQLYEVKLSIIRSCVQIRYINTIIFLIRIWTHDVKVISRR